MSAIAGYTGGGGGLARPSAQAGATPTTATTFAGKVLEWDDLPTQSQAFDDRTGTFLTESITLGEGYARKINGTPHQVMLGFRAYLDRLIFVTAARPLAKQPNGTMKPAGPWAHHEGTVYRPTTPPVRTRGSVAPGIATETTQATGAAPKLPAAHRRAANTYKYLPAPVRSTATKAVANPKVWLGELTQHWLNSTELPTRQTIAMLRMDEERAVVIHAERGEGVEVQPEQLAQTNWEVTQMTYELPAAAAISPTAQRNQLGAQ